MQEREGPTEQEIENAKNHWSKGRCGVSKPRNYDHPMLVDYTMLLRSMFRSLIILLLLKKLCSCHIRYVRITNVCRIRI